MVAAADYYTSDSGPVDRPGQAVQLPLDWIDPDPNNERRGDLVELVRSGTDAQMNGIRVSIEKRGQLTPAVVFLKDNGRYQVLEGHRRRAVLLALGKPTLLSVIVPPPASEVELDYQRLASNTVHAEGDLIMMARTFKRLMANGQTQTQIGEGVDKSQEWVSGVVNLLDLPEPVQDLVSNGALSISQAALIRRIRTPLYSPDAPNQALASVEAVQIKIAQEAAKDGDREGMTIVALTERVKSHNAIAENIRQIREEHKSPPAPPAAPEPEPTATADDAPAPSVEDTQVQPATESRSIHPVPKTGARQLELVVPEAPALVAAPETPRAPAPTPAATTPQPAAQPPAPVPTITPVPMITPVASAQPDAPKSFEEATVQVNVTMYPDDGHAEGRRLLISGTAGLAPVIEIGREKGPRDVWDTVVEKLHEQF